MSDTSQRVPAEGYAGMKENWRSDLIAAFSVAMVALPLALGIAQASGVPPMAGVMSAAIGGIITTFFRGSHLAINGPAAGLITVVLGATYALKDGSGNAFNYVLAAIAIAGLLQVICGLLKLGKLGEIFPSSVIHGVLAAIGVIIFTTQLDDAFGFQYSASARTIVAKIMELPFRILELNPLVALIGIGCLAMLLAYPKINNHLVRFIPAPMWVLVAGVGIVVGLGFQSTFNYSLFGKAYSVGESYLIQLPPNIMDIIVFPNFSRIGDPKFWMAVFSIFLIASIESLASSKAVDKLDPFKRTTDLNKDMVGIGLSTMVSGCLGGLPIITVIVRSSVNVNNHAKTKWANLYHGLILVSFILLLAPVIKLVPLAALGAILVHTGYKLAGPRIFKQTANHGWEQVAFLVGTLVVTLATDLLWGIFAGIVFTFLFHLGISRMRLKDFLKSIYKPDLQIETDNGNVQVHVKGVSNFLNLLKLQRTLTSIPPGKKVVVNLSQTQLVDLTVMEYLQTYKPIYTSTGGQFNFAGHEQHIATTTYPLALRTRNVAPIVALSPRQTLIKKFAEQKAWAFKLTMDWETSYLRKFHFFETRPIEYKENVISGSFRSDPSYEIELADITFDEGAMLATEVYHTTVVYVKLPYKVPRFALEKEGRLDKIFDRVLKIAGFVDIDFQLFPQFSNKYLLMGDNEVEIRKFFSPKMIRFLEDKNEYHIESSGEALMLFRRLRLMQPDGLHKMIDFVEDLIDHINPEWTSAAPTNTGAYKALPDYKE